MQELSERLQLAIGSVLQAGEKVLQIYQQDFKVSWKKKDDPLTEADLAANDIIQSALLESFPQDGFLSEEIDDDRSREKSQYTWILDPIDGKRDFVSKNPEFAVSLGFVEGRQPLMGVIFNPVTAELFFGLKDYGFHYEVLSPPYPQYQIPQKFSYKIQREVASKPTCLISRSEVREELYDKIAGFTDKYQIVPKGSIAYKLALFAAGKADSLISVYGKNDWDICAGVALIESSGQQVLELTTLDKIQFNSPNLYTKGIIAVADELLPQLQKEAEWYRSMYRLRKNELPS
ncbi:MAG: 3'(2'),5'-bisphosphate nucleotidase CysQ [Spirochaetota bacterium]